MWIYTGYDTAYMVFKKSNRTVECPIESQIIKDLDEPSTRFALWVFDLQMPVSATIQLK